MTKKELIAAITEILKVDPGRKEVCIVKYQNKLRNTRWGMHAFTLCAMEDAVDGWTLYVRPWADAIVCWKANLFERLHKADIEYIYQKALELDQE